MAEGIGDGSGSGGAPGPSNDDGPCVGEPKRRVLWSKMLEGCFLDHLSATGNVSAAARMVGISPWAVHYRRRTQPAFAEAWDGALAAGYQSIEAKMIEHVLGSEPFDWDKGMALLTRISGNREGRPHRGGTAPTVATRAESDKAIHAALSALARRRSRARRRAIPEAKA